MIVCFDLKMGFFSRKESNNPTLVKHVVFVCAEFARFDIDQNFY